MAYVPGFEHDLFLIYARDDSSEWIRVRQTLRVTPAMAAGISDHAWTVEEIVALLG